MKIEGQTLAFVDEYGHPAAAFTLSAWAGYACENSRPETTGGRVQLILEPEDPSAEAESIDPQDYAAQIRWLVEHQNALRERIEVALLHFIHHTLIGQYHLDDPELAAIREVGQFRREIDPTAVHLFPGGGDDTLWVSFEFECSWDPEHGCGVVCRGLDVIEVGVSDVAWDLPLLDE
jgi:hypothetical protein